MLQWNTPGAAAGSLTVIKKDPGKSSSSLLEALAASHATLPSSSQRYLGQAEYEEREEGCIISVPTTFQANGLQPFLKEIETALRKPIAGIRIRKAPPGHNEKSPLTPTSTVAPASLIQVPLPLTTRRPPQNSAPSPEIERQKRLSAPHRITSPSFEESTELLKRWAQNLNEGKRSQCVWIYGESGAGKTWLIRQLNTWVGLEKGLVSSDVMSFFHEWRRSIESRDQLSFIRKFRKEPDLFILENLDELAGKKGTQQELLYTVGALLDRGASIAVSSQKNPLHLQELLDPALFSRLNSGLALEMPQPDRAFKESLWRHLLSQHALSEAPIDVVLLERIFAIPVPTARKVHALFINVIGRLSYKRMLDMNDVNELVHKHSPNTGMNSAQGLQSPTQLMEQVARICGLGVGAIQGRVRRPDVSLARRFVCLALSKHLGLTNSAIATLVEKDASTVSHALKTIENEIAANRRIAQQWNYLCSQVGLPS